MPLSFEQPVPRAGLIPFLTKNEEWFVRYGTFFSSLERDVVLEKSLPGFVGKKLLRGCN